MHLLDVVQVGPSASGQIAAGAARATGPAVQVYEPVFLQRGESVAPEFQLALGHLFVKEFAKVGRVPRVLRLVVGESSQVPHAAALMIQHVVILNFKQRADALAAAQANEVSAGVV